MNEKRIARITYNDNNWVKPSGSEGKSKLKGIHESDNGYGNEEWLFDFDKIIDGYHFAFLESIRNTQNTYFKSGKRYDIYLWTLNNKTKMRTYVGLITNVIPLSTEESSRVKKIYEQNGWYDEMQNQIKDAGAKWNEFSKWEGIEIFNIKFKVDDVRLELLDLPKSHSIYALKRYNLVKYDEKYSVDSIRIDETFVPINSNTGNKKKRKAVRSGEAKPIEVVLRHNEIMDSLMPILKLKYEKVGDEQKGGYGLNRIDIRASDGKNEIFFEIKAYRQLRYSIREAIGQLMEYCYYPAHKRASELIIVSDISPNEQEIQYMEHIRKVTNMAIYYQWIDMQTKTLSAKY